MKQIIKLNLPMTDEDIRALKCEDIVSLSGKIYTARDAAHSRLVKMLDSGEKLPIDLSNQAVYYCGPTPTLEGEIIGSCGPTTSSRMDDYAPRLMAEGLRVMIGKGKRSQAVYDAMKKYCGVYLCAIGGAGALMKSRITSCECVAFPELGCESICILTVVDMPLIVAADSRGETFLK